MNLADIRAELEEERTWRETEIAFLRNQLAGLRNDDEKSRFRRAIVLVLYAHYEGFCHFALQRYIKAVNSERLLCGEASGSLVAASWWKIFSALENYDAKSKVFRARLPDDSQLHRFARRRDFVEQLDEFRLKEISVPDDAISTESNLWPAVLKKNLFLVGLPHDAMEAHDETVSRLLCRRNNIAHGAQRSGVDDDDYKRMESAALEIMERLMELVMEALSSERFKRALT